MRCLCSLIMIKSGGRRMADIAMALFPPQVEPWRLKQGTEAMDSWRGNFIDRIYPLLMILSFICRAFWDGIVLVHLEKGQQAVRDVQQSGETEACHHFQAILEQTMVSWWLIATGYTIIRNCIFQLNSVSCFILFCMFYLFLSRVQQSLMQSDAVWCSRRPVLQVLQLIFLEEGTNGWDFTQFAFLFRITRHVGGAGCLHPPVTNKGLFCQDRILELRIGNQYFLKVEDDEEI